MKALKYTTPLVLFVLAWIAFNSHGWLCLLPVLYAFGMIPLLELFLKPDVANLEAAEEELARKDAAYDWILYGVVALQVITLFVCFNSYKQPGLSLYDQLARALSMGILCGGFGINVGHELGHRVKKGEQLLAKIALMTSLYVHFFIEHNKGHHKNVATYADPSSARFGESVYRFWPRTIVYSYLGAWKIACKETRAKGGNCLSLKNEMVRFQLLQVALLVFITLVYGPMVLLLFLLSAIVGMLLLETVNYIEHYGLTRKETAPGQYERTLPRHSWNSNHVVGRLMLFELSRHSDHHYLASRKYQVLRHFDEAPQMPTGYPGMMLLSLLPPLWFRVMDNKIT